MPKLLILRGTPSSGKSTLAQSLKSFKNKIVWLKVDNFKPFFASDITEEDQAIDYVNQTAIASLKYLLSQGFSVVMEGIFQNPEYITQAVTIAKENNLECKIYELECSLQTLLSRDKVRAGVKEGCRKPLGNEVITRLYQVIKDKPFAGSEKLNTEKLSLEECQKILKQFLEI